MSNITALLNDVQSVAVVCNQWGDTGKGKFSDIFAEWGDVIARGTGGANAGHTTVVGDEKRIFHLIPAGIIYDAAGKINILGNGMVLDLKILSYELDELDRSGLPYENLMISLDAHVTLPYHISLDKQKNTSQKGGGIGSTGRGIGPTYADKISRGGVMVRDLFDRDALAKKVKALSKSYKESHGIIIKPDDAISELATYSRWAKPFARDTISEMHRFMTEGKRIVLEGAQGLLLSIEHGTYPYVTSSDCSINGTASGVGLSAKMIDKVFGIVKFPYMTRVGAGPFPSELGGEASEKHCAAGLEHDVIHELQDAKVPFTQKDGNGFPKYNHGHRAIKRLINSKDPFLQGVGIRLAGEEYGATTGRPRRTGWTDLVALKYAVGINGPDVILTKADVLEGADKFSVCEGYNVDGRNQGFTRDSNTLSRCRPDLITFNGFNDKLSDLTRFDELPSGLKYSIKLAEERARCRVCVISTGPERSQYIVAK
jgi:adenylosuccinate synthase